MIKILFLAANPSSTTRLRLDEESRAIDEALRKSEFRDEFQIEKHFAVRVGDLTDLLLRHRPDIVHFSGHGSEQSEIILENEAGHSQSVPVHALNRLFSVLKDNICCVVLNACYSEPQAQAIAEHIDCVVGMSDAITDASGIKFSASFYLALGYGRDVKTAFELGQLEIDMASLGEHDIPQLLAIKRDPSEVVLVQGENSGSDDIERLEEPQQSEQDDSEIATEEGSQRSQSPQEATPSPRWNTKKIAAIIGVIASIVIIIGVISRFVGSATQSPPTDEQTVLTTTMQAAADISTVTPEAQLTSTAQPEVALTATPSPTTTLQIEMRDFDECPQLNETLAKQLHYGEQVKFVRPSESAQPHTTLHKASFQIQGHCPQADQLVLTFILNATYMPRNIYTIDEITATTSALDLDRAGHLGRAIIQYLLSEYATAAQNFEQLAPLFEDTPTQDTLNFLYATSLLFDEKHEAAIAAYTLMEEHDLLRVPALNNRGVAALNQAMVLGWFEAKTTDRVDSLLQLAKDSFTQALDAVKDSNIKVIILVNHSVAQYRFDGDLEKALADCKLAISLVPKDPLGYVCQAAVKFTKLEVAWCGPNFNAEPVRTDLAKAHALAPDYSFIYYWKGAIAELQKFCTKDKKEQERYQQEARENYINYSKIVNEQPMIFAMERQLLSMTESILQ